MVYPDHEGPRALDRTQERQEALRRYHILDTAPEKKFDQVTRLVAQLTDVPTALITLIDKERQWFKSCFGYDTRETSIEISFCVHAVHERQTLVVENALEDPRFKDNPLVTDEPGWRFYAGAPLKTPEGIHIGTLCIIDYKPRVFDAQQRAILEDLADLVVDQFELRSAEAQYRKLFQSNPQPALIYDIDTLEVLDANGAASQAYGFSKREMQALELSDLMASDSLKAHTDRSLDARPPFTARHYHRDGTTLTVEVREESILFDGRQARIAVMTDVAERERFRQYQRLVENVQEVVFETDLDGNATFLNSAWQRITGFSAEEALGDSLLHYVHPKDRVESLQAFASLLQRRDDLFHHRTRFLTHGGAALPVQFRARLLTDDEGTVAGTVGTLTPLEETPSEASSSPKTAPAAEHTEKTTGTVEAPSPADEGPAASSTAAGASSDAAPPVFEPPASEPPASPPVSAAATDAPAPTEENEQDKAWAGWDATGWDAADWESFGVLDESSPPLIPAPERPAPERPAPERPAPERSSPEQETAFDEGRSETRADVSEGSTTGTWKHDRIFISRSKSDDIDESDPSE